MKPEELLWEEIGKVKEFLSERNPKIKELLGQTQNLDPSLSSGERENIKCLWKNLSSILKKLERIEADIVNNLH